MFTGLIEETGEITAILSDDKGKHLQIAASLVTEGLKLGDSVAVDGCCLTVVKIEDERLSFDLLEETWEKTAFDQLNVGDAINLERALQVGDRMGGHFVSGHIDALGKVNVMEKRGDDYFLNINCAKAGMGLLVDKGSIAINGVSLTVSKVNRDDFEIWLIPHTLKVTSLDRLKSGMYVNLEFDMLAKYVQRQLECQQ